MKKLLEKIEDKEAKIAVVGMGYVGLPLAVEFGENGFEVIGIEINEEKVEQLNEGISYVEDVLSEDVAPLVEKGLLEASSDYSLLNGADVVILCVPTPLRKTRDPDISYIVAAMDELVEYFKPKKLVVLESTTYPGTTQEVLLPKLKDGGFEPGEDFLLAFSPERVDPGNKTYKIHNTPKVVGGLDEMSTEAAGALYSAITKEAVKVSSPSTAEMVKLLENTFRNVNIGLVNEFALICDRLGLDVWEVIDAASTKPFGFMSFYPGPGLGGHCIPIDPQYLSWKLKSMNYNARFIELAHEINSYMPRHVVYKLSDFLNEAAKSLRGSSILILGMSYKKNVGDPRESPAIDIVEMLEEKGAKIFYNDPYIPEITVSGEDYKNTDLTEELLKSVDCTVVITNHSDYDYNRIGKYTDRILDTRDALKNIELETAKVKKI